MKEVECNKSALDEKELHAAIDDMESTALILAPV
jgi:hypothetical protein